MNISQEKLSELVDVHSNTIRKWEQGTSSPDAQKLNQLAEVLGTTVGDLMGESEPVQSDLSQEIKQLLQKIASLVTKDEGDINGDNNNLDVTPFSGNYQRYCRNNDVLDLAYWGDVVNNARFVANIGSEQEKSAVLMMLKMATEAITGVEKTPTATTPPQPISAYNGDHSSYSGNVFNAGKA